MLLLPPPITERNPAISRQPPHATLSVCPLMELTSLYMDLSMCTYVHQPFPHTTFLFQSHSSWITEHPSGLQPLGQHALVMLLLTDALLSPEDTPPPHNCTHQDGPAWSGQEGGSPVVVRGGHTQGGSRNTPLALLTGHFHSNTHTISVSDWNYSPFF